MHIVGLVFGSPDGGMLALLTLALVTAHFGFNDATAVAAACPALTSVAVAGISSPDACCSVHVQALPSLTRLSWTAIDERSMPGDLTPVLAGRSLEIVAFGCHSSNGEPFQVPDTVMTALMAAAALPAGLGRRRRVPRR